MKNSSEKREIGDIEKIKDFLRGLGFVNNSHPSSQNLIYSKNGEIVVIKNSKSGLKEE
jgi:hypothetical protein